MMLALLPFWASGSWRVWGKGARTFALCSVSCSGRGAAVTELGRLGDAALTNSGLQNRFVFLKSSLIVVQLCGWFRNPAAQAVGCCVQFVFPDDFAGVSALPKCLLPRMPHMPQDTLKLNKAAAPVLSFHVVKNMNWGIEILWIFAEKEKNSMKTKQEDW